MYSYPIRTILRGYDYDVDVLNRVIDRFYEIGKIKQYTYLLVKTEILDEYDDEYKSFVNSVMECCNKHPPDVDEYDIEDDIDVGIGMASDFDYRHDFIILKYMEDMSIRCNPRLADYLYNIKYRDKTFTYMDIERDYFYPIKKELRNVYLKYEPNVLSYSCEYGITEPDEFGLVHSDWDRAEIFTHTLEYAVKYGDWEEFKEYMGDKLETYRKYLANVNTYEELFKIPKYQTIDGFIELLSYDEV